MDVLLRTSIISPFIGLPSWKEDLGGKNESKLFNSRRKHPICFQLISLTEIYKILLQNMTHPVYYKVRPLSPVRKMKEFKSVYMVVDGWIQRIESTVKLYQGADQEENTEMRLTCIIIVNYYTNWIWIQK